MNLEDAIKLVDDLEMALKIMYRYKGKYKGEDRLEEARNALLKALMKNQQT